MGGGSLEVVPRVGGGLVRILLLPITTFFKYRSIFVSTHASNHDMSGLVYIRAIRLDWKMLEVTGQNSQNRALVYFALDSRYNTQANFLGGT